jgi:hypothetical protein
MAMLELMPKKTKAPTKYTWSCRYCRRSCNRPLDPKPYCDCGLVLELNDSRIPLPEELGQRPDAMVVDVGSPPERASPTVGLTRDEILATVSARINRLKMTN